ncbi:hypothetical protein YC2023_076934 [Brassica napus]
MKRSIGSTRRLEGSISRRNVRELSMGFLTKHPEKTTPRDNVDFSAQRVKAHRDDTN